jgi:hypothetical protein
MYSRTLLLLFRSATEYYTACPVGQTLPFTKPCHSGSQIIRKNVMVDSEASPLFSIDIKHTQFMLIWNPFK